MKIGVVHPAFTSIGGAELLMSQYVLHLKELGHDVRLLTTAFDHDRWARLGAGLDLRIARPKHWTDTLVGPTRRLKLRRRSRRLGASLRGMDVALAGNHPGNVAAANAVGVPRRVWWCMEPERRLYPLETSRTIAARLAATDPQDDTPLLKYARFLFERQTLPGGRAGPERHLDLASVRKLTRIVAISEFSAESVRRVYGRPADAVVYPTVAEVELPRRTPGVDPAGLRVLVHSRLEWVKNIDVVLLAFADFRTRHPGAHELHVVGTGPAEADLRETATRLGLDPVTRFHGFLDMPALEAVYARCEMMALLPPDEPFGMVYPEAAMRGLLIAGPDHGGPMEILDGGRLGWTLDVFSPEPLASAFAEAWGLPIGEVNRRRGLAAVVCRDRFSPRATLGQLATQLTV